MPTAHAIPLSDDITPEAITAARAVIAPHIRHTPWLDLAPDPAWGMEHPLALKLELFQHSGSFKARGAFTNLMTREISPAGVVAASGGNHGAAIAYAAMRLGIQASIFVPEVSSPAKLERIAGYGARLVVGGARYNDALEASLAFAEASGATAAHAYDQRETLLGQGTLGAEIEADRPDIDTLLVAVGGGGLIGGIAAWYRGRVKIVAVEPEGSPTLHMALAAGKPVDAPAEGLAADSLAPKQVGRMMFPLARDHVATSVLVSDDDIRAAQRRLWSECRLVAEPGGAAAFAAITSRRYRPARGERVAVLVCGANTTAVKFD
jgi:threonine dehydratase